MPSYPGRIAAVTGNRPFRSLIPTTGCYEHSERTFVELLSALELLSQFHPSSRLDTRRWAGSRWNGSLQVRLRHNFGSLRRLIVACLQRALGMPVTSSAPVLVLDGCERSRTYKRHVHHSNDGPQQHVTENHAIYHGGQDNRTEYKFARVSFDELIDLNVFDCHRSHLLMKLARPVTHRSALFLHHHHSAPLHSTRFVDSSILRHPCLVAIDLQTLWLEYANKESEQPLSDTSQDAQRPEYLCGYLTSCTRSS